VLRVFASSSRGSATPNYGDREMEDEDDEETTVVMRMRPWLLWRQCGSKWFHVDLVGDFSYARFPPSGFHEPSSSYFITVVVDGEMVVIAGDMVGEAYKKAKVHWALGRDLVAQRGHMSMHDSWRNNGEQWRRRRHPCWLAMESCASWWVT
jgi:hypothetical protein